MNNASIYGYLAEFKTPSQLLEAVEKTYRGGYRKMDAHSPFPIEGLAQHLGYSQKMVPRWVLIGGLIGCGGGFLMQYYGMGIHYPLNIGGRPLNSWPAYIPITFELTVLFASFAALLSVFILNGLPEPYHPLFNIAPFQGASTDRFFLSIESRDPLFDLKVTRDFISNLKPATIWEVPF
jgi:hypothetical protein